MSRVKVSEINTRPDDAHQSVVVPTTTTRRRQRRDPVTWEGVYFTGSNYGATCSLVIWGLFPCEDDDIYKLGISRRGSVVSLVVSLLKWGVMEIDSSITWMTEISPEGGNQFLSFLFLSHRESDTKFIANKLIIPSASLSHTKSVGCERLTGGFPTRSIWDMTRVVPKVTNSHSLDGTLLLPFNLISGSVT